MQEIRHDESKGPLTHFDEKTMKEMLNDPAVKEVRVFKEPQSDDQTAHDQQVPDDQTAYNQASPAPKQQPPKIIKNFLLVKGMTLNIHGTLYKVTASRPNGKVSIKFIRFLKEGERI